MLRLEHITFSCDDPARLAEFWGRCSDYETTAAGSSWLATDPRGEGTRLLFNRMAKSPTIELPIHVDVNVPDREAELAACSSSADISSRRNRTDRGVRETWTVMRDPEGNGFCIQIAAEDAARAYIGNVTFSCAEPRELGRFWANALGWPDEEIDEGFLQQLRDAGVDEPELTGFYVTRRRTAAARAFSFSAARSPGRCPTRSTSTSAPTTARPRSSGSTGAGASVVETKVGTNITFTVMRDPEGNPFCVG